MDAPDPIDLIGRPSCLDCLAWSPDGDLAVAMEEAIYILTPKQDVMSPDTGKPTTGLRQWHIAKITVNLFTFEEWPIVDHDSFTYFSVGEEQSPSHVILLSWSPAGLAIHRRSLLAVLTSNLVLSLWETNGEVGQWKRVCVVNRALEGFFGPSMDELDPVRHQKVINSFSWSPPRKFASNDSEGISYLADSDWGLFYMAVSNSNNELLILQVDDVVDSEGSRDGYSSEVVGICKLPYKTLSNRFSNATASLFYSSLLESSLIEHISWGPWLTEQRSQETISLLAVFLQKTLRFVEVRFLAGNLHSNDLTSNPQPQTRLVNLSMMAPDPTDRIFKPPAVWQFKPGDTHVALAIAGSNLPVVLLFRPEPYMSLDIDKQADCVGITAAGSVDPEMDACFSQNVLMGWTQDCVDKNAESALEPNRNGLCLNVLSCLADGVSIEIDPISCTAEKLSTTPWSTQLEEIHRVSSLKHKLEGYSCIKVWGLGVNGCCIAACLSVHPTDTLEFLTSIQEQCSIAFGNDESRATSIRPRIASSAEEKREEILEWISGLPEHSIGNHPFDVQIREISAQFLARLRQLVCKTNETSHNDFPVEELSERCQICDSVMTLGTFAGTSCKNGHEYTRCNISFLAIQEPGISKYCSKCGKQVLNLEKVGTAGNRGLDSADSPTDRTSFRNSLIWRLFNHFDTCPYCGGKFKGLLHADLSSVSPTSKIPATFESSEVDSNVSRADTTSSERSESATTMGETVPQTSRESITSVPEKSGDEAQSEAKEKDADNADGDEGDADDPNLPVTERTSRHASQAPDHPVELPASPISAPGKLRSFFDTDSESDDDEEAFPTVPVITRASSVRVQRPIVVQHHSADSTRLLHRLLGPAGPGHYPAQQGTVKAEQVLGHSFRSMDDMTSATSFRGPNVIERKVVDIQNQNRDILQATPESHQAEFDTASTPIISPTPQPENEYLPDASTTALAPTPPSSDLSFTPSSIIEVPSTPLRREALDTLPTPMGGFGTLRAPYMHSRRLGPSAVDGLRSNPLSIEEANNASRLHRTLSEPPLPSKTVKNMRRKVTIRPLDTMTANELGNGHRGLFRESIVSTPYPSRATSLEEMHVTGGHNSAKLANSVLSKVWEKPEESPRAPVRDRFPSIVTNEVLKINISIAKHALDFMLVEIPVEDRGTFDDEQLFTQLHTAYSRILRLPRRALPRKISYVSCSSLRSDVGFSHRDFISHFTNPKIGHKRKTWLLWLRCVQSAGPKHSQAVHATPEVSKDFGANGSPDSQICNFTLQTTPKTALSVLKSPEDRNSIKTSPLTKGRANEGTFLASPSTATSLFNEKSRSASGRKCNKNQGDYEVYDAAADVEKTPSELSSLPILTFHHADSVSLILAGLALTFFLSALATIFWILFGVPGKSAANGNSHGGRREMGWRWQEDAQRRVGIGFVFGMFVLVAGLVVDGVWIFIGRTLL